MTKDTTFTFTCSTYDLLKDPTAVLFAANVQMHEKREAMKARFRGKTVQVGQLKGIVKQVSGGKVVLHNQGVDKECSLTRSMLTQLEATTTR
jgi:hypothetical protein